MASLVYMYDLCQAKHKQIEKKKCILLCNYKVLNQLKETSKCVLLWENGLDYIELNFEQKLNLKIIKYCCGLVISLMNQTKIIITGHIAFEKRKQHFLLL